MKNHLLAGIFLITTPVYATVFSPYVDMTLQTHWDDNTQSLAPLDLIAISKASGVRDFHLAFITDADQCNPAWGGFSDYATSKKWAVGLTDNLRAENIPYTVSFGGAVGNDLSLYCSKSQLVQKYEQIITDYQPQGFDFDIENGNAKIDVLIEALRTIQAAHPHLKISFTLPVMPEGLTPNGKEILTTAYVADLNFHVNLMTMDYGATYTGDMGDYAISAATETLQFLRQLDGDFSWKKIEITPLIGVNDIISEQTTLDNVTKIRDFARKNPLGGLSMWSIQRDHPCAELAALNYCSGNRLQVKDYEFSARFIS